MRVSAVSGCVVGVRLVGEQVGFLGAGGFGFLFFFVSLFFFYLFISLCFFCVISCFSFVFF